MTETIEERPFRATKLFVEVAPDDLADRQEGWLDGADGLVLDGGIAGAVADEPTTSCGERILRDVDPESLAGWRDRPGTLWVASGGLDAVMRFRDTWPELDWVPRVEVYRPGTRFDFHRAAPGEGFSMYMPDTSAIQGFRIADAEPESLEEWLARATSAGFRCIWLYGRNADMMGKGADIEMLARARRHFAGGRIWLSGGIADACHLKTLAREGGAKAVVVPASLARRCSCPTLAAALELAPPPRGPIPAEPKPSGCSHPYQPA